MTTSEQDSNDPQGPRDRVPENPEARPQETVDALSAQEDDPDSDEQGVAGEDVTQNPETDELEGLPGPSPDEPGEPAG
jgi:hypothetical protein